MKKDWKDSIYTHQIRITKESLGYLKKIKGKKTLARKLEEILKLYEKIRISKLSDEED